MSPKPKSKTIDDVRKAGFDVGIAYGSVETEEKALAGASDHADPNLIADEARRFALEIGVAASVLAKESVDLGLMSEEQASARVREESAKAGEMAFAAITKQRAENVAFHERALEIAQAMPDVYFVSALGDPSTPDDDIRLYVACKEDGTGWDEGAQEILDALADYDLKALADGSK